MFSVLEHQLEGMELVASQNNSEQRTNEKEISLLGQMVRTLEKLADLDAKASADTSSVGVRDPGSAEMQSLREKIAERLMDLEQE